MATYVNDLRLKEIATGDESGTWGASTNTNLELIAEAFSFGTEAITTNADTHTTTIADGSTDPGRSIFLKYTGTLDSACTITIGPNTVSKLWLIENGTSGSQNIIIKQGSGSTITIPNGQTKAIYSDGAGSGGAMVDAFQDLSIPDLFIDDDLTFTSDSAVITFGADGDTTLTHTDGSGLTLNSTNKLMFNDASQFIQGSSATVLSIGATDEIDLTATAIDINGNADVSGTLNVAGNFTSLGIDDNADATAITIDSSENVFISTTEANPHTLSSGGGTKFFNSSGTFLAVARDSQTVIGANRTGSSAGTVIDFRLDGTVKGDIGVESTGMTINDGSADLDFRVESNGNTHMLFVDAGNDTVVIGSGSVTAPSTVDFLSYASSAAGRSAFVHGSGDGGVIISGVGAGSSASLIFGNDYGSDGSGFTEEYRLIMDGSDDSLKFNYNANASTALTLSSAGAATFGSNVTISTADNSTTLNLVSTDTDANAGPHLRLSRNVTGADNDALGQVEFAGRDDAGNDFLFAQIEAYIVDASNGTEDGYLEFFRGVGGTERVSAMILSPTDTVFNENSSDIDFRVESNGDTHMLFVDAGNDRVGIGTSSPATELQVDGKILTAGGSASSPALQLNDVNSGVYSAGGNTVAFSTDGVERVQIKTSEVVFNDPGNDVNFRVERSGDANAFFVSGSSGSVGIGTNSSLDNKLELVGSMRMRGDTNPSLKFNNNDVETVGLELNSGASGTLALRDNIVQIASDAVVVNELSADVDFRVESDSNTHALFVDAGNDRIGIGQSSPDTLLHLAGADTAVIRLENTDSSLGSNQLIGGVEFEKTDGSGAGAGVVGGMRMHSGGSVGESTYLAFSTSSSSTNDVEAMRLTSSQQLILDGVKDDTTSDAANMNIRTADGLVRRSTSSRRYKNTITDATHGLTELLALRPVTYKGNNDGDRLFGGLIAEEVHDAGLTEFVQYNSDDEPDALAYGHMVSLCIKAIQEQQSLIETLQAEVAALKGE